MTTFRMLRRVLALLVVTGATVFGAAGAAGGDSPTDDIEPSDLLAHLQAFQSIADAHGGNRTFATPGYDASVAYVVGRLRDIGLTPEVQEFLVQDAPIRTGPPTLERTAPTSQTYVEGTDYLQVEPGPEETIESELFVPTGDGCSEADYAGITMGQVALITLGDACTPSVAHLAAYSAGARGVLFGPEDGPGAPPIQVNVSLQELYLSVPTMTLSGDVALELATLAGSDTVVVHLDPDYSTGPVPTTNVIAEIPGRSDDVVMVGAHLDSVPNGPGIDDNGSGAAGVLAVAEHLADAPQPARTIRFAWWGAEENNLLGSTAYADSLTEPELGRIVAYLNVDMLGAPNWVRGVADPAVAPDPTLVSPGSDAITARFVAYFEGVGEPSVRMAWNGRSDDAPFAQQGVPTGGLSTATGVEKTEAEAARFGGTADEPYDPCYHLPCDTLANVDLDIAADLTRALGAVAWELATEGAAPAPVHATPAFTG